VFRAGETGGSLQTEADARVDGKPRVDVKGSLTDDASLDSLWKELTALRKENTELRGQVQALTEASVHAAKLVSELDETRLLAARLREREDQLELARDQATEASRAKSAFLANMSHELRTPLNAILGYSEIVEEALTESGRTELVPDLARIRAAGKHLLILVTDLLEISRIEAGKVSLDPQPLELAPFLAALGRSTEPLATQNGNQMTYQVDRAIGTIEVDAKRLQQVLGNLLSNACKFTNKGRIELGARRSGVHILIHVKDTGIGMPIEQMDRLFSAFTQGDSSASRRYGGAGLGLNLARKLTELMDGEILVDTELGKGSTFTMKLPVRQRPSTV